MVLLQVRAGAYACPEEHEGHVHDVAAADGAERAHGDRSYLMKDAINRCHQVSSSYLMKDAIKRCHQRSTLEVIRCHQAT